MCGIFGWVGARAIADAQAVAWRALHAMRHRGPDGEDVWLSNGGDVQICFGHVRLAIIDPAGGAQPFRSHDRRYVMTYNGEVYNYIELRERLAALGHRFVTGSDTEVVVEAFRRYGTRAFGLLRGMFALAIHDTVTGQVVIARDAVGKKPLFTATPPGGGLAFASEIEALLTHPERPRAVDLSQLSHYLVQRYLEGPNTFFQGIRKLPPGHFMEWRGGAWREDRYYCPPLARAGPEDGPLEDSVAALEAVLDESVRLRMRSDAPYGMFLSGGIDSAVVLALMARHSNRPIRTFCVGFDDDGYSELRHAAEIAGRLGADHREMVLSTASFTDAWSKAIMLRGAPVSEASDIPILLLSQMARESVKMVLTGEGADELLAGYPKYRAEAYLRRYRSVFPSALHRKLLAPLVAALPYGFQKLKILSRAAGENDLARRGQYWFASTDSPTVARLMGRPALPPLRGMGTRHPSPLRALQLRDFESWLPDNLLERGDRMMMGGSIEGRMPFMDTELAATVSRFPDAHLTGHPKGKLVLRKLAETLIDPTVINRRKIGFTVPVGEWFRTGLREQVRDLLMSQGSRVRQILDGATLTAITREHDERRQDHSKLLWTLTNLEQFLRLNGA